MELNLEEQKQRFLDICRSTIQRDGLDVLLDWLCKADFFQAPASTKYHGAYVGFIIDDGTYGSPVGTHRCDDPDKSGAGHDVHVDFDPVV